MAKCIAFFVWFFFIFFALFHYIVSTFGQRFSSESALYRRRFKVRQFKDRSSHNSDRHAGPVKVEVLLSEHQLTFLDLLKVMFYFPTKPS